MVWVVETLNAIVDEELATLPDDMRARFVRVAELIEAVGLPNVREPHVKHIRGPIWEIRLKGRAGIARALYVTAGGRRVVVVRVFVKKTQKTPRAEIELALRRAKEITCQSRSRGSRLVCWPTRRSRPSMTRSLRSSRFPPSCCGLGCAPAYPRLNWLPGWALANPPSHAWRAAR